MLSFKYRKLLNEGGIIYKDGLYWVLEIIQTKMSLKTNLGSANNIPSDLILGQISNMKERIIQNLTLKTLAFEKSQNLTKNEYKHPPCR